MGKEENPYLTNQNKLVEMFVDTNACVWTTLRVLCDIKCSLDKSNPDEYWKIIIEKHYKNLKITEDGLDISSR